MSLIWVASSRSDTLHSQHHVRTQPSHLSVHDPGRQLDDTHAVLGLEEGIAPQVAALNQVGLN